MTTKVTSYLLDLSVAKDLYSMLLAPMLGSYSSFLNVEELLMGEVFCICKEERIPGLSTISEAMADCSVPTDVRIDFLDKLADMVYSQLDRLNNTGGFLAKLTIIPNYTLRFDVKTYN